MGRNQPDQVPEIAEHIDISIRADMDRADSVKSMQDDFLHNRAVPIENDAVQISLFKRAHDQIAPPAGEGLAVIEGDG